MEKANQVIRNAAKSAGIKLWQIAYEIGMTDGNFSRMLRKELSDEKKSEIFRIIENLQGGRANDGK